MQSYKFSNPSVCIRVKTTVEPCDGKNGEYWCNFGGGVVVVVSARTMAAAARKALETYKQQII